MSIEVRYGMNGSPTRLAGQAPHGRPFSYLTGLRAQRTIELTALRLAPAVTAGAITYEHLQSRAVG